MLRSRLLEMLLEHWRKMGTSTKNSRNVGQKPRLIRIDLQSRLRFIYSMPDAVLLARPWHQSGPF